MARSKKDKKPYKDLYASAGIDDKYFGTIYEGMCKSKQFQDLPSKAKVIYTLCRVHSQTKKMKACLYKHSKDEGREYRENDFVFPDTHQNDYGETDHSNFHKYMKKLIDAGFIDIKENNKHRKKVNVYSFSTRWKNHS